MDFETMVLLRAIAENDNSTTLECRRFALEFFDSCYGAGGRVGMVLMKLEQAGLVTATGLPARYSITEAGKEQLSEFKTGVLRYLRVFKE